MVMHGSQKENGLSKREYINTRINSLRGREGQPGYEEDLVRAIGEIFQKADTIGLDLFVIFYPEAKGVVENWQRKVETKAVPAMPRPKAIALAVA